MYVKPEVTRYSGTELLDLMGPVETAYTCELRAEPTTIECDSSDTATYIVDISDMPDFTKVVFSYTYLSGADPFSDTIPRSEGTMVDSTWRYEEGASCNVDYPGYTIEFTLKDDDGVTTESCSTEITVTQKG
jgi:hypothetical protein